jgi:hypothetical protein
MRVLTLWGRLQREHLLCYFLQTFHLACPLRSVDPLQVHAVNLMGKRKVDYLRRTTLERLVI